MARPAGTKSIGDYDTSADDTICDPKICGTNEKVVNHIWVACPAGKAIAPGWTSSSGRCRISNGKHGGFCQKLGFGAMQDHAAQKNRRPRLWSMVGPHGLIARFCRLNSVLQYRVLLLSQALMQAVAQQ